MNKTPNQIIGIRLPPDLIDKAEELTTQLQKTDVSDFGGTTTRSGTLRRSIRIGLGILEEQIKGVKNGQ